MKKKTTSNLKDKINGSYQTPLMIKLNQKNQTQRNEKCPCGSGKKFKKCCMSKK